MNSIAEVNKSPFTVTPPEVDYFQKNYPIHHAVLLELVRRGEAVIKTPAQAGAT